MASSQLGKSRESFGWLVVARVVSVTYKFQASGISIRVGNNLRIATSKYAIKEVLCFLRTCIAVQVKP